MGNSETTMTHTLRQSIEEIRPEIEALRHELHEHPEIRFEEKWTSDRVAAYLEEAGVSYTRGHAKGTGIVARIDGSEGKTVALRADMDALEIEEETGLPYASRIPNRMHACGHDGHTACLCGVAKTLMRHREQIQGSVKLIFQPAEEQAAGGRFIVEEGHLDGVAAVFALHGWPTLAVGKAAVKSGAAMASADFFRITVEGKGCHAADPGAGVDPIVAACALVTAFQTIVSREINPGDPAVVTVARIESGNASNVIPEKAVLEGTFRALKPRVREQIFESIERLARLTAEAHGARAQVEFIGHPYPPLHNDETMSAFAREVILETFGDGAFHAPQSATMAAEDFAFYLEKVPGAFVFLGVNPHPETPYPTLHNSRYDFSDEALPYGMELMCRLAIDGLERI